MGEYEATVGLNGISSVEFHNGRRAVPEALIRLMWGKPYYHMLNQYQAELKNWAKENFNNGVFMRAAYGGLSNGDSAAGVLVYCEKAEDGVMFKLTWC